MVQQLRETFHDMRQPVATHDGARLRRHSRNRTFPPLPSTGSSRSSGRRNGCPTSSATACRGSSGKNLTRPGKPGREPGSTWCRPSATLSKPSRLTWSWRNEAGGSGGSGPVHGRSGSATPGPVQRARQCRPRGRSSLHGERGDPAVRRRGHGCGGRQRPGLRRDPSGVAWD